MFYDELKHDCFFITYSGDAQTRNISDILLKLLSSGIKHKDPLPEKVSVKFSPELLRVNPAVRDDYKKPFWKFSKN